MLSGKWPSLAVLSLCQVAALGLWFSASAVLPSLVESHALSDLQQSLYTSSVQAGFVFGTLISAVLGLADRLNPKLFFAASTVLGATANAAILVLEPTSFLVALCRFITGMSMAGVYPVGMKMAATWAAGDMGLVVGVLVGALTLGSASPHLFNAFGGIDWQFTVAAASLSALAAAVLIWAMALGPNLVPPRPFDPKSALWIWKLRPLRFATLGYLGHMWELYAMWAWLGVFLHASFAFSMAGAGDGVAATWAKMLTFATIGVGALGCVAGGLLADRVGRTALTMGAMAISGLCCLVVGFLFQASPWLLGLVCLVWGLTVVADSAQFSASVAELSNRYLIGTMLTVQTSLGFLLTLITIHLMPLAVDVLGWTYAFAPLALGPFFGVWAMARLRGDPEATRLAGGRR
ncbi:MAG: MFS transporter [Alphaproteobacteria bacterium]|nr:MFS transporter [Alphaproteobacteria bacterium]